MLVTWKQVLANGLSAGAGYALIALGFHINYSVGRFFNFSLGASYILGGYLAYSLVQWRVPATIAIVGAALGCGFVGVLSGVGIFKPLRLRRAPAGVVMIASLGLFIALQNMAAVVWGNEPYLMKLGITRPMEVVGFRLAPAQIVILVSSLSLFIVVFLTFRLTRLGLLIRGLQDNPRLAGVVGLPVDKIVTTGFFLSSALVGLAGIIQIHDTGITPTIGLSATLIGIVAFIIGGMRSLLGTLIGGLSLGLLHHAATLIVSGAWREAISFLILIFVLLANPHRLLGRT